MSDYRFDICEHNGIACLHVMIDPGEDYPGSPYLVSTHIPLDVIQTAMKRHLAAQVFQGLGAASMCWEKTPKGVFDSTRAVKIGEDIMQAIKDVTGYDATDYTKTQEWRTRHHVETYPEDEAR